MHTHDVSHMHDGVEEDDNSVLKTKLWETMRVRLGSQWNMLWDMPFSIFNLLMEYNKGNNYTFKIRRKLQKEKEEVKYFFNASLVFSSIQTERRLWESKPYGSCPSH